MGEFRWAKVLPLLKDFSLSLSLSPSLSSLMQHYTASHSHRGHLGVFGPTSPAVQAIQAFLPDGVREQGRQRQPLWSPLQCHLVLANKVSNCFLVRIGKRTILLFYRELFLYRYRDMGEMLAMWLIPKIDAKLCSLSHARIFCFFPWW
jgi:hypothetical protein